MNDISIIDQLQVIAQCAQHEFQIVLMYACLSVLAVIAVIALAVLADKCVRRIFGSFRNIGFLSSVAVCLFTIPMIIYGGSKRRPVQHPGGDEDLRVVGIYASATNEVTAAGATNTWTEIDVDFIGTGVTIATPVHVRMSETNEWTELTKIEPTILVDLQTNNLHFCANGDLTKYPWWWVGEDTPAIRVETVGITLVSFVASSHSVAIEWTCDDQKATEFEVQIMDGASRNWVTILKTSDRAVAIQGFFIDRTTRWRITSTYTKGE